MCQQGTLIWYGAIEAAGERLQEQERLTGDFRPGLGEFTQIREILLEIDI
jgi:hypothetical protein